MEFLKKVGKFFLGIITILSVLMLMAVIVTFSVRKMSEHYFKAETIRKIIGEINITDLLLENAKESEQLIQIKNVLEEAGIPEDTVGEFLNSSKVNEFTSTIIEESVDYVVYGKEFDQTIISADHIYRFLEDNMSSIVLELQKNNVPKSELLTAERQEEILTELKEKTPVIEEQINNVSKKIEEAIENSDSYNTLKEYQNKLEQGIHTIQYIYSDTVTTILIVSGIAFIVLIMISRLSFYKGIKWVGLSFLWAGIALYLLRFIVKEGILKIHDAPESIMHIIDMIAGELLVVLGKYGLICLVIALLLFIVNGVIVIILHKKEEQKFDI